MNTVARPTLAGRQMAQADMSSRPCCAEMRCSGAGLTHLLAGTRFGVAVSERTEENSLSGQAEPALYIVDASGSSELTIGLVEDAKRQHPLARIVAIANSFDLNLIQLAVTAGVDSFCLATVGREVLINTPPR